MIRKLDLSDSQTVERILSIQMDAYAVEAGLIGFDGIPPLNDTVDSLQQCGEEFFGFPSNGKLEGIVSVKQAGAVLDIHRLAVDPAQFRHGIAGRLLHHLESLSECIERIVVCTGADNRPAIHLYRKHGYHETGEILTPEGVRITALTKVLR